MIISEKHEKLVLGRDVPMGVWCQPTEVPKSLYFKDPDEEVVLVIYTSINRAGWYTYLQLMDHYGPVLILNQALAEKMNQVREGLYAGRDPKKPFLDQNYTNKLHTLVSRVMKELNA